METVKLTARLTREEKETHIYRDYVDKKWIVDSTISTDFNKALRQGWIPTMKYIYDDGTVAGYRLEAPSHAITIRNAKKKEMSEKQMKNLHKDDDDADELEEL